MRRFFLLIFFLSFFKLANSQGNHVFQDDRPKSFKYYVLNAGGKYQIQKVNTESTMNACDTKPYKAELYNVHLSADMLLLFSVLPSPIDNSPHWSKIKININDTNRITDSQLLNLCAGRINRFIKSGYRTSDLVKSSDIKVVYKTSDTGYFINDSDCLTEIFLTKWLLPSDGFANQTPQSVIDITNPSLTIKDFETQYYKHNKDYSYNSGLTDATGPKSYPFNIPLLLRSDSLTVLGHKSYSFWTLDTWWADGLNLQRGIDRFVYSPEIGILGGDYTFYFRKLRRNATPEACRKFEWEAYLNNKLKLNPVKITVDFQNKLIDKRIQ